MAYAPPGGFQGWVPTDFSVELRTPQGEVLPTVRQGDKSWVVGEPGQEFTVTVTANGPIFTDYRVRVRGVRAGAAGHASTPASVACATATACRSSCRA
jgi:hypothetical protein